MEKISYEHHACESGDDKSKSRLYLINRLKKVFGW